MEQVCVEDVVYVLAMKLNFACVDGPDFDGHLVDFDEAMSRNRAYMDFEKHEREKHAIY